MDKRDIIIEELQKQNALLTEIVKEEANKEAPTIVIKNEIQQPKKQATGNFLDDGPHVHYVAPIVPSMLNGTLVQPTAFI